MWQPPISTCYIPVPTRWIKKLVTTEKKLRQLRWLTQYKQKWNTCVAVPVHPTDLNKSKLTIYCIRIISFLQCTVKRHLVLTNKSLLEHHFSPKHSLQTLDALFTSCPEIQPLALPPVSSVTKKDWIGKKNGPGDDERSSVNLLPIAQNEKSV